jgi:hypothetical protein
MSLLKGIVRNNSVRFACLLLACVAAHVVRADEITEDVKIEGRYLRLVVSPGAWGGITEYGLRATVGNYAGEGGLLQEGFGVPNYYVPSRRLNARLESAGVGNALDYFYDCDGPNIRGLHVTRTIEPIPDEASVRVRWKIKNKGDESHWIAPWVRNPLAPGGKVDPGDRLDVPALNGIRQAERSAYYPASRNWIAATDPVENVTVYGVFNADHTYAFLALRNTEKRDCGFQTAFTPRLLNPGDGWETAYRINAVRGLKHVDFATDELAAQVDYQPGRLVLLLAAVKALQGLQIRARILAENGQVWRLPPKVFDIDPTYVVRSTYEWTAPGDGAYDFMAQLTRGKDEPLNLGKDTAPPHGGIDTQFVVGTPRDVRMEAWTDAPFTLERGPRPLKRTPACAGSTVVWFEDSMEKIYPTDVPEPDGRTDPTVHVRLARNEHESFQVVVRPPKDSDLHDVDFLWKDLVNREGGARIAASNIHVANVAYCPVRIPSYFEGPTGECPDPLPPFKPFTAAGGRCAPTWFTVYVPPRTPAGRYTGALVMKSSDAEPVNLTIEVTVYDFDLPVTPALKTDFGFRPETAVETAKAQGGTTAPLELIGRYVTNAFEHRVTLREPAQFPAAGPDYATELRQFEPRLKDLLVRGATTFSVPASLLDNPDQLRKADAFIVANKLQDRAFCQIADEPAPETWPPLVERMKQWHAAAPNIALMSTVFGLQPFIPEALAVWTVHTQILDTPNNKTVLEAVQKGHEVWWYVRNAPPRPYANFLLDFAGVEHRIVFWQTWALGIRGIHYWSVNACEKGRDPYVGRLDLTPVNGDGVLVYPGPNGPVNSIRWEIIRDGIEDYDYLSLLMDRFRKVQRAGGHEALIDRAAGVLDLKALVPDLVSFSRDSRVLAAKRDEIARMIVDLGRAL